ncbi:ATP-grasp ribosomal peptide maturase [Streptomyces synnematoformans]|uniref:ATP-grasp ribosomal peptide maturase n=1 Tax=Streptomyces synnematoformans TaxID=415721 RepID=A0ABP5KYC2_9ACTN
MPPTPRGGATVLVATRLDDASADEVITELNRRRVPVARVDPGDFPERVAMNAEFGSDGLAGTLSTPSRRLDLGRVRSVYWRRPRPYSAPECAAGQDARWAVAQARYGLGGVLAALPAARYVNHPWRNRDAEYKPAQLATAAACGLNVPPTLITNDPLRARAFACEYHPVLYKPLRESEYHDAAGRALAVWVADAPAEAIGDGVAATAHLFQRRVDKIADVRLTAVGDRLFAVRIDGSPGVDWRRHYENLTYTLIDTPGAVTTGVRAYLDTFGLAFGAFDFGLDAHGRFWFYECNPNGQWAFFPAPITRLLTYALADHLQYQGQERS